VDISALRAVLTEADFMATGAKADADAIRLIRVMALTEFMVVDDI